MSVWFNRRCISNVGSWDRPTNVSFLSRTFGDESAVFVRVGLVALLVSFVLSRTRHCIWFHNFIRKNLLRPTVFHVTYGYEPATRLIQFSLTAMKLWSHEFFVTRLSRLVVSMEKNDFDMRFDFHDIWRVTRSHVYQPSGRIHVSIASCFFSNLTNPSRLHLGFVY